MRAARVRSAVVLVLAAAGSAHADDAARPRLHPVEAGCIDYELSGQMQKGTLTRCHRGYGYEQYEIQKTSVGFGGFTQSQNQHVITIGDTIYTIDLGTNTGKKTKNPMYDQLASSLKGKDPESMADSFISAMGFEPTGAKRTVAGVGCSTYESPMSGTVCLTDKGLMLEQSFMGNTTRATAVSIGKSGDAANCRLYEKVAISDGPDLQRMPNLKDLMKQQGPR